MIHSKFRVAGILLLSLFSFITVSAEDSAISLTPQLHGVMRARWEMDSKGGENRFQLRNARLNASGWIAPEIDYFFQADFCDQGSIKFLDGWGRIALSPTLKLQAGQFRLPFGADCFRAPGTYYFTNLSFIGGTMNNVRGVGAKLSYKVNLPETSSLLVEGGAFNPATITDQKIWVKEMAFAGKAVYNTNGFKLEVSAESLIPDSIRINSLTASATWTSDHWIIEGEYLNKRYANSAHKAAHGYNFFVDYNFPIKAGTFNRGSIQARFDGMTAHSNGFRNSEGKLTTTDNACNRITIGGAMSYNHKSVRCDIRLNYEKYFYHHNVTVPTGSGDKICAEMIFKF